MQMEELLIGLNDAQREAVININGPSLVIAGAGSGKTRVLTMRIANLLNNGVAPYEILALTFTNKAAREMKDRIASVVGAERARYLWMGTFHSIFSRILREQADKLGYPNDFTIYDTADSKNLIKSICKDLELSDKTYKPATVLGRISKAKNNLISPIAYAQNGDLLNFDSYIRMPRICEIYKEYAKRCTMSGAMDFDDLLFNTNILFRDFPEVLQKYQERFKYFLVDEYQDTNFSQYLIVKKLAQKSNNICVVGDDAQSIYSFRGARIENILNFKKDYPELKTYRLEQNYRSTQTIVDAANSVIKANKNQLFKNVFSENEVGDKISVNSMLTDKEEGFVIAREIQNLHLAKHQPYKDIAILYRTNSQSRIFEEAFRQVNIPYKIYGGLSFYQRKEIKDVISYMRLIVNSKDNEALKRIINYPKRGIGTSTLTKLEVYANSREMSIWQALNKQLKINNLGFNNGTLGKLKLFYSLIAGLKKEIEGKDAHDAASTIVESSGILSELHSDKTPEGVSRYENLEELLNGIKEFSIDALEQGLENNLSAYMLDVSLLTDQDEKNVEDDDFVTLMTMHASKGLEFSTIFIVGVEEGLFPSQKVSADNEQGVLEEERRLFYVALTRAEKKAYISFCNSRYTWGETKMPKPSRFIYDIDMRFVDASEYTIRQLKKYTTKALPAERATPTSPSRLPTNPQGYKSRLTKLNPNATTQSINTSPERKGTDIRTLKVGIRVEHNRFGKGTILQLVDDGANSKATILFDVVGSKSLILAYASLTPISET
ncbi:MAG: ATP-dependent helicase [Bacteroidales bacterium]